MTRYEKLGNLIGMSADVVKDVIDEGMVDILIELNEKGYRTIYCCEGHCKDDVKKGKAYWEGYLAFADKYIFKEYPPMFYKYTRNRSYFYWEGNGENSRKQFLDEVYKWACCLPTRDKKKIVTYHLIADHKNQPNRDGKVLCYTTDYEDVKCTLQRSDMNKYCNFKLMEDVQYI